MESLVDREGDGLLSVPYCLLCNEGRRVSESPCVRLFALIVGYVVSLEVESILAILTLLVKLPTKRMKVKSRCSDCDSERVRTFDLSGYHRISKLRVFPSVEFIRDEE